MDLEEYNDGRSAEHFDCDERSAATGLCTAGSLRAYELENRIEDSECAAIRDDLRLELIDWMARIDETLPFNRYTMDRNVTHKLYVGCVGSVRSGSLSGTGFPNAHLAGS